MPRSMNVKQLREWLASQPDDAILVTEIEDHNYRTVTPQEGSGLWDAKSRIFSIDYGEDSTPEAEFGKRLPVVVF